MRIAQISGQDLAGRAFNGYDLQAALNEREIPSRQYVVNKRGADSRAVSCISQSDKMVRNRVQRLEASLSMDSLLYANSARQIREDPFYQSADISHFHLFYGGMISLFEFAAMAKERPTVWTMHDLWPVTGHCIHPVFPSSCGGWRTGCQPCPGLSRYFPMQQDKAGQMWRIKQRLYREMNPDIVVSSQWLERYVRESPLTRHFTRIHRIPFGVHLEEYGRVSREEARSRLRIPQDAVVLAFRTDGSPEYAIKGSPHIWEALRGCGRPFTLLVVGWGGIPADIMERFPTIQLGWTDDKSRMIDFFAACDIFLMPSEAETFGLMAVEAMASARPVVVFEDTALAAVTHAPECGAAVPYRDSGGLRAAICRLTDEPEERLRRGALGHQLAQRYYRFEDYVDRHIALYREILERGRQ